MGPAIRIGAGVAVGVAVLVGEGVAVGNDVALGADVGVGAGAGVQADKTRLISKRAINVCFIVRVLPQRSGLPNGARFRCHEAVG